MTEAIESPEPPQGPAWPWRVVQGTLAVAIAAYARALALALAACWLSAVEPEHRWAFLEVWSVAFFVVFLPVGAVEGPLRAALAAGLHRRRNDAFVTLLLGASWAALGGSLWPAMGAIGFVGMGAVALAGALAASLVPASNVRVRSGVVACGIALLPPVGLAAALLALDPNARYEQRYDDAAHTIATLPHAAARAAGADAHPAAQPARTPGLAPGDLDLAQAIATTFMAANPPATLRWSWEEAVAVEGLLAYAAWTSDPQPWAYARAWVDAHRDEAEAGALWADHAAPGLAVLTLRASGRATADDHRHLVRLEHYLTEQAPRTRLGALSHAGLALGGRLPAQAWVDSLFMHGVYLNRLAVEDAPSVRTGQRGFALGIARDQARAQSAVLQDAASGLFRHAYVEFGERRIVLPVERMFWARGSGWAFYFLVDHQLARKALGLHPDPVIDAMCERLAIGLLDAQDATTHLWRTDLLGEGPEVVNPTETSASALIVAALRRGAAGAVFAATTQRRALEGLERAMPALRERVRWQGEHAIVTGTSIGTHPGFRRYYRRVAVRDEVGHGVGAMLLALSAGR